MQCVVFLVYHGMGHFNACFRMAKALREDHDVVFAGVEFFKDYVEAQGFMYYPLKSVPFGMGFETWANQQKKSTHVYINTIKDRWKNTLFHERRIEVQLLLHDLSPDYIFIDAYQSTDFIVLYPLIKKASIRIGFIQTMLPTIIDKNLPPINSLVLPNDVRGIRKAVRKFHWMQTMKNIKQWFQYVGMSDHAIILKRLKRSRIPQQYYSSKTVLRGISFSSIAEFILAPREFDFENADTPPHRHYLGFMTDADRIEIADPAYFKIDAAILKKINETQCALIYCSFGTVKIEDSFAVNAFLQKLLNTVSDTDSIVIISHNAMPEQNFTSIPENVYFLKAAPQLEILKRADVFITHGGLNSIKESIYAGVPMLVYPLQSYTDTMGNSTRVIHHKLGLRGDLLTDTGDDIGKKIECLINDDQFRDNLNKLRIIDETYSGRFMDEFNNLNYIV